MKEFIKKTLRTITKAPIFEPLLVKISQGHNEWHPYVRLIPRHWQYNENDLREVNRNGINYKLTINNYNDFLVYYGIDNQGKGFIYELAKADDWVFDVGSNIGEVILNIAKVIPNGKVYGFEPVPYNFQKLTQNLSLNNFTNIEVNNVALSDKNETLYFDYQIETGHSGSISMKKVDDQNSNSVKALRFDDFIKANQIEKVDYIKVDVEGFEFNFLKGAKNTIEKFKPKMFIELDDNNLKKQNTSASELVKWLEDLHFYTITTTDKKVVKSSDNFIDKHFDIICHPI